MTIHTHANFETIWALDRLFVICISAYRLSFYLLMGKYVEQEIPSLLPIQKAQNNPLNHACFCLLVPCRHIHNTHGWCIFSQLYVCICQANAKHQKEHKENCRCRRSHAVRSVFLLGYFCRRTATTIRMKIDFRLPFFCGYSIIHSLDIFFPIMCFVYAFSQQHSSSQSISHHKEL